MKDVFVLVMVLLKEIIEFSLWYVMIVMSDIWIKVFIKFIFGKLKFENVIRLEDEVIFFLLNWICLYNNKYLCILVF